MIFKPKFFIILTVLTVFLSISYPALAQERGEGGGGDNRQTPVQVIVQIVVTAGILKFLNQFDLP